MTGRSPLCVQEREKGSVYHVLAYAYLTLSDILASLWILLRPNISSFFTQPFTRLHMHIHGLLALIPLSLWSLTDKNTLHQSTVSYVQQGLPATGRLGGGIPWRDGAGCCHVTGA